MKNNLFKAGDNIIIIIQLYSSVDISKSIMTG